ncbi:MAG: hypothetical protein R2878_06245 [Thermoleophilia bacterium]
MGDRDDCRAIRQTGPFRRHDGDGAGRERPAKRAGNVVAVTGLRVAERDPARRTRWRVEVHDHDGVQASFVFATRERAMVRAAILEARNLGARVTVCPIRD